MAADTIAQSKGTSGPPAPYGAAPDGTAVSAIVLAAVSADRDRPSAFRPRHALTAVLSLCLMLLVVTFDSKRVASQESAVAGTESVGLRPGDVERAIWLLDDLSLFFGSLSEQERNQFARENWTTAQDNYETAAGRLAERFGRGQIRIAELAAGQQAEVQGIVITLDRDLDGAWPADRISALRERGQDDWIPLSRLSAVLLRALAPTFDLDQWSWFQDHLRRTPAIARLPGEPDADAVAAVTGFGFLRDRYLLSTIMAETAPRTDLRRQWAGRRDSLDEEARAFFERQSGGAEEPTAADFGRQWAEFTKSSLQVGTSWADKRTEPEVPSFGRVSDSDLPLLVQRAARPANPLDRYALALPVSPLEPLATAPFATGSDSNQAEDQRPVQDVAESDAETSGTTPADVAQADVPQAGTTTRPEPAGDPSEGAGPAEASDRSPAATEPLPAAGPTDRQAPDAAASFPLPQLSGLEEKLEQAGPSAPAATETTVAVPAPPAPEASDLPVQVEPGTPEAPASSGDTAPAATPPAEDPVPPIDERPVPAEAQAEAQEGVLTPQAEATETPEAAESVGGLGTVQDEQTRQPGDEQVARLSDRDTAPQGSHLSVWIEGIGAEGMATIGLAILSFFALSLLMALWLRALFKSERTQEGGEQPIIVVVETERGRPIGGAFATAGAVPDGGNNSRAEFIAAPPEEARAYAAPPASEPDVWPSTEATEVDPPVPAQTPPNTDGETPWHAGITTPPPLSPGSAPPTDEPVAAETPHPATLDPTKPETTGENTQQVAPDRPSTSTARGGDGVTEPRVTVRTEGDSVPPVRAPAEDVAEMASEGTPAEDVAADETWPAAPSAPTAPFEPTGPETPREDDRTAVSTIRANEASDAATAPRPGDDAARNDGSMPRDPAPAGQPGTSDDAESDRESDRDAAAPDAIVEPNQIEEALVALRDGQDIAARELDPEHLKPPRPFATVVPPITLEPDPDAQQDDPADATEAQPNESAAMESAALDAEAAPADPQPSPEPPPEPPAAAWAEPRGLQDGTDAVPPPLAPEPSNEDASPADTPVLESKSEDIAADDLTEADTAAATDRPVAPDEEPVAHIAAPQADSLFKEIGNALRAGDMTAFHSKFGDLTLLPPDRVERILYSPGGEDFAVTCRALGVDKLDFASLFLLVRKQCLGEERVAPHRFSRVLALYDEVEADAAEQVLDRWRTDPTYPGIRDRVQDGQSPLNG